MENYKFPERLTNNQIIFLKKLQNDGLISFNTLNNNISTSLLPNIFNIKFEIPIETRIGLKTENNILGEHFNNVFNNIKLEINDYDFIVGIKLHGVVKNSKNVSQKVPKNINLCFYTPIGSKTSCKHNDPLAKTMFNREIAKLKTAKLKDKSLKDLILLDEGDEYADTRVLFDPRDERKLGIYIHDKKKNKTNYLYDKQHIGIKNKNELKLSFILDKLKEITKNKKMLVLMLSCRDTTTKTKGKQIIDPKNMSITKYIEVENLPPKLNELAKKERDQTTDFKLKMFKRKIENEKKQNMKKRSHI